MTDINVPKISLIIGNDQRHGGGETDIILSPIPPEPEVNSALLFNEQFNDDFDTGSVQGNQPGHVYLGISLPDVYPDKEDLLAGVGANILQAANFNVPQTATYIFPYTTLSGNHGDTRRLSYFLVPTDEEWESSNIISFLFTLNFAPSPFEDDMWYPLDNTIGGSFDIYINELPFNNGLAITDLKYQLNGVGPWVSLGGATPGIYTVNGVPNGINQTVRILSVNSQGESLASGPKEFIASLDSSLASEHLVRHWEASEAGIVHTGADISSIRDVIDNAFAFANSIGTPQYSETGGPATVNGPFVKVRAGESCTMAMTGAGLPVGAADRTMISYVRMPGDNGNFGSMPMYGSAVARRSFGISVGSDNLARADFWEVNVSGTTSFTDNEWHLVTVTLRDRRARIYIDGVLEGFSDQLDIDTASNIMRLGRSLGNITRAEFDWCAIKVFNHALNATQIVEAENVVKTKHGV
jgi:hypothetical protein